MATKLTIRYSADLSIGLDPTTCSSATPGAGADVYVPRLLARNLAADADAGSRRYVLSSPSSFTALPWPTGLQASVLYIRSLAATGADLDVRVTFAVAGATVIPVGGQLLLEPPGDDYITLVEAQGEASLEWAAWGATS